VAQGAPFDAFGVGTSIGVGAGSVEHDVEGGSLGGVYKNVAYVDESGTTVPKVKIAGDKTTLPGAKEAYRIGAYVEDVIQLADEPPPATGAERLLKPVMRAGRIVPGSLPPLSEIWELASRGLDRLPERYRRLTEPDRYPVRYSEALLSLRDQALTNQEHGG
jgi:nicotinate phosphoribosyltransferase